MKHHAIAAALVAASLLTVLPARAEWVSQADATDAKRAVWCNAQRSACIVSWQHAFSSYVRVVLMPGGAVDCQFRRPQYVVTRTNGTTETDVRLVHVMRGTGACLIDIPQSHIDGTRSLRFSLPMLVREAAVLDLPLDGFDLNAEQLPSNRTDAQ
jgi:hypothetical protein